jgi:hypothetical protein
VTKRVGPLLISILCFSGCGGHVDDRPEDFFASRQNQYFPLAVGNRWVYEGRGLLNTNNKLIVQITGYQKLGDRWFAVVNQRIYENGQHSNQWTRLWSYGEEGQILMHDSLELVFYPESHEPRVYMDIGGQIGSTWRVHRSGVFDVALLARLDSVLCHGRWYHDCLELSVLEGGWEHLEQYSRAVGLIRKAPYEIIEYEIYDPKDGSLRAKY